MNQLGDDAQQPAAALRIMLVEDDVKIAIPLAEVLTGMGHDVCAIEATEANAVAAADRYKPSLLIVDVHLGYGSGISAVEEILRAGYIPHVYITGDVLRVRSLKPYAVVIQKPFREADLARAIGRALSSTSSS